MPRPSLASRFCRLALPVALLTLVAELPAQELIMKDGRKVPAAGASRRGNQIFVRIAVGGGSGQIAYDVAQIDAVKLPESAEMNAARRLMADDKAAEALPLLERVLRPAEPFRGLGEDRWGEAMLLKSTAQLQLGRLSPARETLGALVTQDGNSAAGRVARLRLAGLEAANAAKADEWLRLAESELAESNPAGVRAEASLLKAKVLLDREEYEQALRAALFVTIFFFDERMDVSRAQLIAGECYLNMDDKPRAVRAFHDVVMNFPKTAAATEAQKEIAKGGEPFAVLVKSLENQEKENQNKLQNQQEKASAAEPSPTPAP